MGPSQWHEHSQVPPNEIQRDIQPHKEWISRFPMVLFTHDAKSILMSCMNSTTGCCVNPFFIGLNIGLNFVACELNT